MYAQIQGNTVTKLIRRPEWFNDDGSLLTNAQLAKQGVVPVIDSQPPFDPERQYIEKDPQIQWLVLNDSVRITYTVKDLSLADVKQKKQSRLIEQCNHIQSQVAQGYPNIEVQTWPVQFREYKAWEANSTAPTPFLDGVASARGIDRASFMAKVGGMISTADSAIQLTVGKRQKLRDQIDSAATIDEVLAVPDLDI